MNMWDNSSPTEHNFSSGGGIFGIVSAHSALFSYQGGERVLGIFGIILCSQYIHNFSCREREGIARIFGIILRPQ